MEAKSKNVFPKSVNRLPLQIIAGLTFFGGLVVSGITYYSTAKYTRVGYMPTQPVAFDHALHVNQLGMDCRYCHTYVDQSSHSNVPAADTCMKCHSMVQANAPTLAPIRESYNTGEPVPWVRIHKAPDYVYFNHAVHVNRGVSCIECHGQVNQMEVVYHAESHTMAFCLDCHRNPEEYIRPNEEVYNLDWKPASKEAQLEMGRELVEHWRVNPPESCSGCHR
ncbi:MAG: cytochrome c3 family protein [Puniceicoccaceae bacterium]